METILVVDDNPEARNAAGGCLADHGVTPLFAENGREALKILEHQQPDAVLTDLHMPEMSGLELVKQMREKHSNIPVVLMTAHGSEQAAVNALRAGALSYVPKKDLKTDLCDAMSVVLAAVEAKRHREWTRRLLRHTESHFELGYEHDGAAALVSYFQSNLSLFNFCDETGLFQVSTALTEALNNAIDHGSLELDSALRENGSDAYAKLRQERTRIPPYRDRQVRVRERLTPEQITYEIRDEGPGFDLSTVPDPTDPENLLKASGRGLMLIRMFMDEVTFNDVGNEITMVKRRAEGRQS
jgi:CheY-like chemotaxis protein/anti-sigma regulatory factor (Ser/Thr protein kinase)